jgi:acetyltransferase-like isoleucine patch superfamily enzyme
MTKIDETQIIRKRLLRSRKSPIKSYIEFTIGDEGFLFFLKYELLITLIGFIPGATGLFLRRVLYRTLLKKVGKGAIIGRSVVLRHPRKITLGDHVTIDDYCLIDARGSGEDGVVLESEVILNRNCSLKAKTAPIRLGKRTSIGEYSSITSLEGVAFGEAVLTGGGCYFSSGNYAFDDPKAPIMDQGVFSKGPIKVGSKSYFGARSSVVGGVAIGEGAVIGACSLVIKDVEPGSVVAGVPAKVIKRREVWLDNDPTS